jgi:MFS family permease
VWPRQIPIEGKPADVTAIVESYGKAMPQSALPKLLIVAEPGAIILVGASALGDLADLVGRKRMFIAEMVIFSLFLVALTLVPNFPILVLCVFGAGVALGCDYPTAHMMISSESPDIGAWPLLPFRL